MSKRATEINFPCVLCLICFGADRGCVTFVLKAGIPVALTSNVKLIENIKPQADDNNAAIIVDNALLLAATFAHPSPAPLGRFASIWR